MAITTFTGDLSAFFAAGTSLEARPASNWPAAKRPPEAGTTPVGSAAATAASNSAGVLSLTGLADSTEYYVSDAAGSRYVRVTTFPQRQEVMTSQADRPGGFPALDADSWVPAVDLPPDAINARRYLKGDGTDETTRLNNLLTAAAGGAIVIPADDYYVPGQIVVPDAAIQIVMQKGGRFTRNVNDRTWMVGGGTKTVFAGGVLAANATAGATTLTLTDASTVSAGDRFILRSTLSFPSANGVYGEQVRVLSKASNVVTLYAPIIETYNTANGARLDKANLREDQFFEGLKFEGVANTGVYGAMALAFLLSPSFRNLTFRNLDGPGLQLDSVLAARGWKIDGFDLQDNVGASRFGYLLNLNGATQGCEFAGGYSERVRHHTTTNGDANGVPHDNDFIGLRGRYATTTDFDSHEDGRGNRWIGCDSRGSVGGYKLRAPDSELIGCTLSGFLTQGLIVNSTATNSAARSMRIWDNRGTDRSASIAADDFDFDGRIDNINSGSLECAIVTGNRLRMNARLRRPGGGSGNCLTLSTGTDGHVVDVTVQDAAKGVDCQGSTPKSLRIRPINLSSHFIDGANFTGALAQAITPGASPYVWTNTLGIEVDLQINGGTVSDLRRSNDGSSFTFVAGTSGSFRVAPGAAMKVTYSVVPTMNFIPVRG